MKVWRCPKCHAILKITESDGLWCTNGCYISELELWEALPENTQY